MMRLLPSLVGSSSSLLIFPKKVLYVTYTGIWWKKSFLSWILPKYLESIFELRTGELERNYAVCKTSQWYIRIIWASNASQIPDSTKDVSGSIIGTRNSCRLTVRLCTSSLNNNFNPRCAEILSTFICTVRYFLERRILNRNLFSTIE